jgi:hypothetical protein
MAKFVPKVGDPVFMDGHGFVRYVVIRVNPKQQTADVKNVVGTPIVQSDGISWSKLLPLDESQNALRIVREATEGK